MVSRGLLLVVIVALAASGCVRFDLDAPFPCDTHDDCPDGRWCESERGVCSACAEDLHCASGEVCRAGACEPGTEPPECETETDCDPGEVCEDGVCVDSPVEDCERDDECGDGRLCIGGVCVDASEECASDDDCTTGVCHMPTGECIANPWTPPVPEAPSLTVGEPSKDGACVRVPFTVSHGQGRPVDVRFSYTVDRLTWPPASGVPVFFDRSAHDAPGEPHVGGHGLPSTADGRSYAFVWAADADLQAFDGEATLRLQAFTDGEVAVEEVLLTFDATPFVSETVSVPGSGEVLAAVPFRAGHGGLAVPGLLTLDDSGIRLYRVEPSGVLEEIAGLGQPMEVFPVPTRPATEFVGRREDGLMTLWTPASSGGYDQQVLDIGELLPNHTLMAAGVGDVGEGNGRLSFAVRTFRDDGAELDTIEMWSIKEDAVQHRGSVQVENVLAAALTDVTGDGRPDLVVVQPGGVRRFRHFFDSGVDAYAEVFTSVDVASPDEDPNARLAAGPDGVLVLAARDGSGLQRLNVLYLAGRDAFETRTTESPVLVQSIGAPFRIGGRPAFWMLDVDGGLSHWTLRDDGSFAWVNAGVFPDATALATGEPKGDRPPDAWLAEGGPALARVRDGTPLPCRRTSLAGHVVSLPAAPAGLAVVDIDGDGRPSLVVGESAGPLRVARGTGEAGHVEEVETLVEGAYDLVDLFSADLSGDGRKDLVIVDRALGLGVLWAWQLEGDESGPQPPACVDETGICWLVPDATRAAVVDYDGDGLNDLLYLAGDGHEIVVELNDARFPGHFGETVTFDPLPQPAEHLAAVREAGQVVAAVAGGDGGASVPWLALAVLDPLEAVMTLQVEAPPGLPAGVMLTPTAEGVRAFAFRTDEGDGDAWVLTRAWTSTATDSPWGAVDDLRITISDLATGDVTGNGEADLVVLGGAGDGTASVILVPGGADADGPGGRPRETLNLGGSPRGLQVADLTGDGRTEVIVGRASEDPEAWANRPSVAVLFADREGRLSGPRRIHTDPDGLPTRAVVRDATRPGRPDLHVSRQVGATTAILAYRWLEGERSYDAGDGVWERIISGNVERFAFQDLDGDGLPDLVAFTVDVDEAIDIHFQPSGGFSTTTGDTRRFAEPASVAGLHVGVLPAVGPTVVLEGEPPHLGYGARDRIDWTESGARIGRATMLPLRTHAPRIGEVFGTGTGQVVAHAQGSVLWMWLPGEGDGLGLEGSLSNEPIADLALADVHGTGLDQILIADAAGLLVAHRNERTEAAGLDDVFDLVRLPVAGAGPPSRVVAGDVTGDGRPEIVSLHPEAGVLVVHRRGAAAFALEEIGRWAVGPDVTSLQVADLDGDGVPDVVVVHGARGVVEAIFGAP